MPTSICPGTLFTQLASYKIDVSLVLMVATVACLKRKPIQKKAIPPKQCPDDSKTLGSSHDYKCHHPRISYFMSQ